MRLIDADALENESIPFETRGGGRFIALGSVRSVPTIDPENLRPKGAWIEADDGDGVVCSFCAEDFCTIIHETDRFNFCPNCGADMR